MKKLILSCVLLSASNIVSALSIDDQRDIFSESLALQEEEEWEEAKEKAKKITDYPLSYMLEYNYLRGNIKTVNDQDILDFIREHKSKVVSNDLQRTYLFSLANQEKWKAFLTAYPNLPNNRTLQCHYLQASIEENKAQRVWEDAREIWLSSDSLPNACDGVYRFYKESQNLTQNDIWQRFELTYKRNKQGVMRYLITMMDDANAAVAAELYELYQAPENVTTSELFPSRQVKTFDFIIPTIRRLARQDFDKGMEAYKYFEKKGIFTEQELQEIQKPLATTIVQYDKTKHFKWMDETLLTLGNTSLIEQRLRYAIKRNDWEGIEYWLTVLPESDLNGSDWQYWQAKVLEHNGATAKAKEIYKKVAKNRNYHGFLAAEKLGVNFSFNAVNIKKVEGSLTGLEDELSVIEELRFHDLSQQTKRQWSKLLNSQSKQVQQQLGLYAFNKKWPYLSVLASINSKSWGALNIRFPSAKPELFVNEAKKYDDLEESYIYAITRRESSFDERAKSHVGASGYMQLMPKTAEAVAEELELTDYEGVEQLNEGEVNVQLGTAYFNGLLTRYNGNRILATAAYNAGPHRVDRWLRANKENDNKGIGMDNWVDSIPYYETRAYVQNVLAYNLIYRHILDQPLKFLKPSELSETY